MYYAGKLILKNKIVFEIMLLSIFYKDIFLGFQKQANHKFSSYRSLKNDTSSTSTWSLLIKESETILKRINIVWSHYAIQLHHQNLSWWKKHGIWPKESCLYKSYHGLPIINKHLYFRPKRFHLDTRNYLLIVNFRNIPNGIQIPNNFLAIKKKNLKKIPCYLLVLWFVFSLWWEDEQYPQYSEIPSFPWHMHSHLLPWENFCLMYL